MLQLSYLSLDHCRHRGLPVLKLPFAPCGLDGSLALLFASLPGPVNADASVAPLVIAVRQIDNQLLATDFYAEAGSSLLGSPNRIKGGKVLDSTSIRKIQVAAGLETQNNTPAPATN